METIIQMLFIVVLNIILHSFFHRTLVAQNLAFRYQLRIYLRKAKKPRLKERDRFFLVFLSLVWSEWMSHILVVKPETVLDWKKRRFKRYWAKISKSNELKVGRPSITIEHIEFIRKISSDHPTYGEDRIAGILKKNL